MPLTEQLLQIFVDQLVASLIVPMHAAYILDVVRVLNPDRFFWGIIMALFGNILGSSLSYILGYIIANSFFKIKKNNQINQKYKKFYFFMLLVPLNYFGGVISFLSGFGHMDKVRFFTLVTGVNLLYFFSKAIWFLVL